MLEDNKLSIRDLLIIVGLFVFLIGLVIFAESRTKSYQEVIIGSNAAAVVGTQGEGTGQDEGTGSAVRYRNTIEFIKMVVLITLSFIMFIAIFTTMIILGIRIVQRRLPKSPKSVDRPPGE